MRSKLEILRQQPRPGRFLLSRLARASGLWRLVRIRRDGYVLRLHPAALSLSLWVDGKDRPTDSRVVKSLLSPGDVYVDVGANIGHLAIEAALAVGPSGTVFAFEPHPKIAQFLRENVRLNGLRNVMVAQAAVGDRFGWIWLSDRRADDQNAVSFESGDLRVPLVTLDELLEGRRVRLLKVDVEGFEKFVFAGARRTLERVDYIYFEVQDSMYRAAGYTFGELHDFLSTYGFEIGAVDGDRLRSVSRDETFQDCVNLLAFRDRDGVCRRLALTASSDRGLVGGSSST